MIKKLLFILVLSFVGLQASSQVLITILFGDKLNSPNLEFGLEGGYNWSNISGLQSSAPLGTFNLGFYFDFRIKKNFYFYTGVLVKSNLGANNLTHNDVRSAGSTIVKDTLGIPAIGDYSQRLNYFIVPLLAKYRWNNHLFVEGGLQTGLMYKSWVEFNADVDGRDAKIKDYNRDLINKIDVGALVGAGYKFKKGPGWSISVRYYYGFVDVYKNISNTKNSSLFIQGNIPIGAAKKKSKTEEK